MPRQKIPWKWNNRREMVARLVAEDILPDREIAKRGGINPSSLYIWRTKPEFMARVDQSEGELPARNACDRGRQARDR